MFFKKKKKPQPKNLKEAVDWLSNNLPANTIQMVRGSDVSDLTEMHFGLGMWIRNELKLWEPESQLLKSCGTDDADTASGIILKTLRQHLVETATASELAESKAVRKEYDDECKRIEVEYSEREAAKDALITDKRCQFCGKPCPSYRKTCKYCGKQVRTG